MKNTSLGDMSQRVTWRTVAETNTNGKISNTLTTVADYWASVEQVSSDESVTNDKVQGINTYKVVMRKVGAIKVKDLLVFETKILQIESVIEIGRKHTELVIMCKEIPSQ